MATNGDRASRDEIRERLGGMEEPDLLALADENGIGTNDDEGTPLERDELIELLAADPSVRSRVWISGRDWASSTRRIDVVGTAAAAAILNVERPRIGRWVAKGSMPQPVAWVESGPIWRRTDIEAMREAVDARRR